MVNKKVKFFAFDGIYKDRNYIGFFILNDNNKVFTVNRKIGKYGKTIKRVLETDNVEDVNKYLRMLKTCNVGYAFTQITKNGNGVAKREGYYYPKGDN